MEKINSVEVLLKELSARTNSPTKDVETSNATVKNVWKNKNFELLKH